MPGDVLEPYAVQEVFADNLDNLRVINGVLHGTFYSLQEIDGVLSKVAVIRMAMPVSSVPDACAKAVKAVATAVVGQPMELFTGENWTARLS